MTTDQKLENFRAAAQRVCRQWQKFLRLEDWDVEIVVDRHYDMPEDCGGAITMFEHKRQARLRVIDPRDANPRWQQDMDTEATIVHELLHLYFEPFEQRSDKRLQMAEEQAVHAISVALVSAARAVKRVD